MASPRVNAINISVHTGEIFPEPSVPSVHQRAPGQPAMRHLITSIRGHGRCEANSGKVHRSR
ncbi:hypothetical protein CY34DRAFT_813376 [Suillus luteus UH-Slu-Lm8-n1]|uniref:Uncharacterized protein n=1 Tax=Suillus luteus UH-Slu-Lm8-n1 TaxID=930992 RepID=A0A0C9ZWH4_9AGAM|nr:hypothetical protein CY34DRAFT_813376 [Suillus luteus UH-Slu-Lm8-n1]